MSSNSQDSCCASTKNLCTTEARVDEVEFDWTIKNFDLHEEKGTYLQSSLFSSPTNDKFKWHLLCSPNGEDDEKEAISVYLCLITDLRVTRVSVFGEFTISILNQQPNVGKSIRSYMSECNSPYPKSWGFSEFLVKDDLFRAQLCSNNYELTFRCSVRFSEMNQVRTNVHRCKPKISPCTLSNDLESLFNNPEFSDVTLSVEGKNYHVHKQILVARSPVFAAMFRHKTTETEQNRVVIEDVKETVMGELLKFIYTGKCQNPSKHAKELLVAADKYALDGLKSICVEELCKSLSMANSVA